MPSPPGAPVAGAEPPADDAGASAGRARRPILRPAATAALVVVPALVLAVAGHQRRWMSDDGLIFTRAVRMIVAGEGPNFMVGERAESSTSTAWQWLLAAADAVSGDVDPALLAVYGGLVCSAAGMALAVGATVRLHRGDRPGALLLPAGVVVYLAVPAAWDFVTSGLETGLQLLWIGAAWAGLVRLHAGGGRRTGSALAVLLGAGVLVRPDVAVISGCFFVAALVVARARLATALRWGAAAAALPVAYEGFRAGYYGLLVPMPALTKEATESLWGRGLDYLANTVGPYWLGLPLAVVAVLVVDVLARRGPPGRTAVVVAPVASALLLGLYVVRVGGDFMHARMLLPPLLLLLLPVLVVPVRPVAVAGAAALAAWAVVALSPLRTPFDGPDGYSVQNVRRLSRAVTGLDHPVSQADWVGGFTEMSAALLRHADPDVPTLYWGAGDTTLAHPLRPGTPHPAVHLGMYLGLAGAALPLDHGIVDGWSLSNPLGSHLETAPEPSGPAQDLAGHEKPYPAAWFWADWADPAVPLPPPEAAGATREAVAAARRTLRCGAVRELLESVREPMTVARFVDNLRGAVGRTALRIPRDPFAAEARFCGTGGDRRRPQAPVAAEKAANAASSKRTKRTSSTSVGVERTVPTAIGAASSTG